MNVLDWNLNRAKRGILRCATCEVAKTQGKLATSCSVGQSFDIFGV